VFSVDSTGTKVRADLCADRESVEEERKTMAKVAKTADRSKMMDTSKGVECPKCNKATRIVKRVKDRERGVPGGVYISCSACDFYEKL
jgi:DNA-directed RNA polymerase subunit M/transcription elongation factor TFIIS